MKNILIFAASLLFIGWCLNLQANDSSIRGKKNLLRKLSQTGESDTMRLVVLHQLITNSEHPKVELYYINRLLEEAQKQKNKKYICEAYLSRMYLEYNLYNVDEVNRWMKLLEPIAREEKFYDLLFMGKRCVVDMLMVKGEYELEEKEAKKMMEEARKVNNTIGIAAATQALSNIYRQTYRDKSAAEILEENYPVALKAGKIVFEAGNSLIATYGDLKDYPKMLKWLKIQEKNIQQYLKKNPDEVQRMEVWLLMTYVYYMSYYGKQNNIPMAEKYLKLADEYFMEGYSTSSSFYYIEKRRYYYNTKQFDKALTALNGQIKIIRNLNPMLYINLLFDKAYVLREMNKEDEALAIYDSIFNVKDSIQFAHLNMQTDQLKKDYDADNMVLEQGRIQRYLRIGLIILVVIFIVVLISFAIHAFCIHKRLKRSEEEMRKMTFEMEQANIAKERFLSNISKTIREPLDVVVEGAKQLSAGEDMLFSGRRELARHIDRTSAELMKLINNILDFSRLEAGMMRFNSAETEMVLLMRSITADISAQTGCSISCSFPDSELYMEIDGNRIRNVIENLFYSPEQFQTDFSFTMNITPEKKTKLYICVTGTILASSSQTQDLVIMNEINRMIIEHFGGTYEIKDSDIPSVCFTI